MKKILIGLLIFTIISAVFVIDSNDLLSKKVYANEDMTAEDKSTVEVYGSANIDVKPDVAYINIGVNTENDNPSVAQKENKVKMDKIISSLKEIGLTDDELQTLNYSIRKNYRYLKDDEREEYYVVSNSLKITILDLEKIGTIIDLTSNAGANNINSIQFAVLDDSHYYNEALTLAMESAKEKANSIMSTFEEVANKPKTVIEISNNYGVTRDMGNMMMKSEAAYDSVVTPIQAGNLTITARVKVIYEY
ncbi:MAG: SIMPL domain-containing protein [Bacillota bacterium]|nr:SIMPL domain-containing protein [Bacillota bacterium]